MIKPLLSVLLASALLAPEAATQCVTLAGTGCPSTPPMKCHGLTQLGSPIALEYNPTGLPAIGSVMVIGAQSALVFPFASGTCGGQTCGIVVAPTVVLPVSHLRVLTLQVPYVPALVGTGIAAQAAMSMGFLSAGPCLQITPATLMIIQP